MSCYSGTCGQPSCNRCYPCDPCTVTSECPLQLDTGCVLYHKNNSAVSELDNLSITNGASLELILEEIDAKLGQLDLSTAAIPILRESYVINNLRQLAEALEVELAGLHTDLAAVTTATPLVVNDSTTIDFTNSGTLGHTLTGSVKVSATSGNRVRSNSDGLFVGSQTLSPNYVTKELTISGGNTISLASMASGVAGYLGEVASDPPAINGQTWFNSTSSQYKVRLNGATRVISIT